MTLGGRRVKVSPPRMRTADDERELPVERYLSRCGGGRNLSRSPPVDRYADGPSTGAFIMIEETGNNTVGAGMVEAALNAAARLAEVDERAQASREAVGFGPVDELPLVCPLLELGAGHEPAEVVALVARASSIRHVTLRSPVLTLCVPRPRG